MCNRLKCLKQYINPPWYRRRNQFKIMIIFIILLSTTLFLTCEKDTDIDQNPVYKPSVEMQFGTISALVQEVSFQTNGFSIVGDLRTPVEGEEHPAIIMVHGSGNATRYGAVPFEPLIEIFLQKGFAVLSWDKPGNGESEGVFNNEYKLTERAEIVAEAVKILADNPTILSSSIGLWGISAAGWVMPMSLGKTNGISFMIVVSGGGEDSIEQYAYQVSQVVACDGGSSDQAEAVELYWSQMAKATEYNGYREAVDILVDIPGVYEYTGLTVSEEDQWRPWPRDIDAFFDPMDVIRHTTIPILVLFGELDKNIDPVQGAQAYEAALKAAGNKDYIIKVIQDVAHILTPATTGCLTESVGSKYVPEYMDILEKWLNNQNL